MTEILTGIEFVSNNLQAIALLGTALLGALTFKQRQAIHERDSNRCQFPIRHKCNGNGKNGTLNVHHIAPQRWCYKREGMSEDEIDEPYNLLTICTNSHTEIIHPDMKEAKVGYSIDKSSYKEVFERRDKLIEQGTPYWNQVYDKPMFDKAKQLTERAIRNHWIFPPKK